MGFFESKSIRSLHQELIAAHVACAMAIKLPPAQQARIAATAPREIAGAARAAAQSGKGEAARLMLARKMTDPPKACPTGITWEQIIQAGLNELEADGD
jgi:hypothetical protein